VQRVAERLARLPLSGGTGSPEDVVDLSAEVIALLQAKQAHGVNAKVADAATELNEHILDILG